MGAYLDQIKALSPDAYAKIAELSRITARDKFGGQVQDYQAQIFTPLKTDAPSNIDLTQGQSTLANQGYKYVVTSVDSDGNEVGSIQKDLGTINGAQVIANYDPVSGNLTGYNSPSAATYVNDSTRAFGNWDANGNPTPRTVTASSGGFFGSLFGGLGDLISGITNDITSAVKEAASNPIVQTAALAYGLPVAGAALGTELGVGTAAGTALAGGGLAAAQGASPEQIATGAALGALGGTIGSEVAGATGSQAAGQLAGGTTSGLLSGQDLGTSLTNAAINTGANQAAGGLLNTVNTPTDTTTSSSTYTPLSTDYTSGSDYSLSPLAQSTQGLQATPAALDMSNPYSFDTTAAATGGLGLTQPTASNNADMGGGQGLLGVTATPSSGTTLGSVGATADSETASSTTSNTNPATQNLLGKLLAGLLGTTGTNNMATTTANNNLLGGLLGGALTGAGGLMQGSTSAAASQAQADALRQAGQLAQQQAQFRPVGTTTTFGTSNFTVDPTTGQLTSAGYALSPQLQAYQDAIMGANRQSLTDVSNLQNLGRQYIAQSPQEAAQQWMTNQQALLQPSRDVESARLANQLQQTGRTGLSVAQGGSLAAANPEQQALANARAMQDLQLAAQAQQQGQAQTTFGQGLLSSAYQPFNAGLTTASNIEQLGQQPLTLSQGLGTASSTAGARAGQLGLGANTAASQAALQAGQYNPYASALSGLGGSSLFGTALGNTLGNTALGGALGSWLGGLSADQLNSAASNWIAANPDITPTSTVSGNGADILSPDMQALLGL